MVWLTRQQHSDLISDLSKHATQYDFYQLVYLLEHLYEGKLKFSPNFNLSFPATDIHTVDFKTTTTTITSNFMGLYGVDAPLPHFFLNKTCQNNFSNQCLRDFLDIINQRIYRLVYEGQKKFQAARQFDHFARYLTALSGNLSAEFNIVTSEFFSHRVRNSTALTTMLKKFLHNPAITVQQFIPQWLPLTALYALGNSKLMLGENTVLGESALDCTSKIQINIAVRNLEEAKKLLPTHPDGKGLFQLLQIFLPPTITFSVQLKIKLTDFKNLALGNTALELGWNCCLGKASEKIIFVLLPHN